MVDMAATKPEFRILISSSASWNTSQISRGRLRSRASRNNASHSRQDASGLRFQSCIFSRFSISFSSRQDSHWMIFRERRYSKVSSNPCLHTARRSSGFGGIIAILNLCMFSMERATEVVGPVERLRLRRAPISESSLGQISCSPLKGEIVIVFPSNLGALSVYPPSTTNSPLCLTRKNKKLVFKKNLNNRVTNKV